MASEQLVEHKGIVTTVEAKKVTVSIVAASACASCQGKSFCSMSDKKDKKFVTDVVNQEFTVGDEVLLTMRLTQGLRAVVWAYIFPLCLLMIILLTLLSCKFSEAGSALAALTAVTAYYFILYRMRNRLKKKYVFEIKKLG
ncbi:MAG: SoxR reducing system RseC family protein [Bacteroidales bacterium]|nr:SoxR reducing system RseC family protein [Bacteroidales bacterium]MCL2133798.1 SoxR reducing system RseC family protein [Bacteroidales bacterium]